VADRRIQIRYWQPVLPDDIHRSPFGRIYGRRFPEPTSWVWVTETTLQDDAPPRRHDMVWPAAILKSWLAHPCARMWSVEFNPLP
jgi:hypothetical protein